MLTITHVEQFNKKLAENKSLYRVQAAFAPTLTVKIVDITGDIVEDDLPDVSIEGMTEYVDIIIEDELSNR